MRGDGDGWVTCDLGHRHWGRHGAAGLLLRGPGDGSSRRPVLVQLRVEWSHHGGTWGLLGGARDSHETPVDTALREAGEEGGIDPSRVRVSGAYTDDHGGWSYTTVLADVTETFPVAPANAESVELRWVPEDELASLALHPHFAITWPRLLASPRAPVVIVDAANVVGSRPDGWWRDRLGAARRLRDRLILLARHGLSASRLPYEVDPARSDDTWYADVVMVTEGAARPLAGEASPDVRVVGAERSGDDAIVSLVAEHAGAAHRTTVVVTADRELGRRCQSTDHRAVVARPGWLTALLDEL
ncbi:MAG: NUDIX domain-containing protein [Streptosporangiales bacterium]|nr:NUDIX domain-containing protein [Streptosporangiales bacterium]